MKAQRLGLDFELEIVEKSASGLGTKSRGIGFRGTEQAETHSYTRSVIPGRREVPGPESRNKIGAGGWIPGSLTEFIIGPAYSRTRSLAPRSRRQSGYQLRKNLDGHADAPWFRLRPILYNQYRDVWACRAFKRSLVVISLIRLNAGQPHLRLAEFTERTTDDPLLGKCLIFSHATPLCGWRGIHTN